MFKKAISRCCKKYEAIKEPHHKSFDIIIGAESVSIWNMDAKLYQKDR